MTHKLPGWGTALLSYLRCTSLAGCQQALLQSAGWVAILPSVPPGHRRPVPWWRGAGRGGRRDESRPEERDKGATERGRDWCPQQSELERMEGEDTGHQNPESASRRGSVGRGPEETGDRTAFSSSEGQK